MEGSSPARLYCLLVGGVLVVAGIIGFFYEASFAVGNLRHKYAVVQAVVDHGKPLGDLTVDQLVALIRKAGR